MGGNLIGYRVLYGLLVLILVRLVTAEYVTASGWIETLMQVGPMGVGHLILLAMVLTSVSKAGSYTSTAGASDMARVLPIKNNIRRLRFEAGEMTQAELATQVGVTRQTLPAIEAAKYSPTLEQAFKTAAVFQVPGEAVFQYEE